MIRTVLGLRAKPGRSAAVEDFYRERGIIERARAFPGCRGATLLRRLDGTGDADTHLVVADWTNRAAYEAWVADPWRVKTTSDLVHLLDTADPVVGRCYQPISEEFR